MAQRKIFKRVRGILDSLPAGVTLVAVVKGRAMEEVREAIEAGVREIGCNYVQEAEAMRAALGQQQAGFVRWHLIGHLQQNKAKKAARIFDVIETIDSMRIAEAINRACVEAKRTMPVLIEVNSGREPGKTGVAPDEVEQLIHQVSTLSHLRLFGLMTMGAFCRDVNEIRACFRWTKELFDRLGFAMQPGIGMRYLSMGMSDSYRIAIEYDANIVRIGTAIFGERPEI